MQILNTELITPDNKVIKALKEVVDNHPKILREPEPFIRMSEHIM